MKFSQYARYWVFVGITVFATTLSQGLQAATMHAILVADTTDDSIGDSVEIDLKNMLYEVDFITKNTGMVLKKTVIQGNKVLTKKVLNQVKNLKVEDDDLIFFYYSGHGYREQSKEGRWPNLFFSLENKGIDFEYIRETLEKHNPRLLVLFADVCNSMIPDSYAPQLVRCKALSFLNSKSFIESNYKRLFLESSGVVMATSSSDGEYSYCTESNGGFFTMALLQNLSQESETSSKLSWDRLLTVSQYQVYQAVNDQHPDFCIELK